MFSAIKSIFSSPPHQNEAHSAYVAIVTQSRQPFFYKECAVADTVDGRFDVVVLHMFLVIHRLRREPSLAAGEFARALQEVFFADMDRSVREMGVSDTGVGKRVKAMAQAFYGRLHAYEQSLSNADAFKQSLKHNLYRDAEIAPEPLKEIVKYAQQMGELLKKQDAEAIIRGQLRFS